MKINEQPYEEDLTDSLININIAPPFIDRGNYGRMFLYLKHKKGKTSKEHAQTVLGKQLKCVNYTHRNWVWTFSDERNTACINLLCSETGEHWEYRAGSNIKTLKKLVKEIEKILMT